MHNQQCQYCGHDTYDVDIDYLVGTDHLSCALDAEMKLNHEGNPIEKCVMCGDDTEYHFRDHVDMRVGYIEGAGQLCTKCYQKDSSSTTVGLGTPFPDRRLLLVEVDMITRTPNDQELGAKVRQLYYETYNNG